MSKIVVMYYLNPFKLISIFVQISILSILFQISTGVNVDNRGQTGGKHGEPRDVRQAENKEPPREGLQGANQWKPGG